jgi:hypothetical protein
MSQTLNIYLKATKHNIKDAFSACSFMLGACWKDISCGMMCTKPCTDCPCTGLMVCSPSFVDFQNDGSMPPHLGPSLSYHYILLFIAVLHPSHIVDWSTMSPFIPPSWYHLHQFRSFPYQNQPPLTLLWIYRTNFECYTHLHTVRNGLKYFGW